MLELSRTDSVFVYECVSVSSFRLVLVSRAHDVLCLPSSLNGTSRSSHDVSELIRPSVRLSVRVRMMAAACCSRPCAVQRQAHEWRTRHHRHGMPCSALRAERESYASGRRSQQRVDTLQRLIAADAPSSSVEVAGDGTVRAARGVERGEVLLCIPSGRVATSLDLSETLQQVVVAAAGESELISLAVFLTRERYSERSFPAEQEATSTTQRSRWADHAAILEELHSELVLECFPALWPRDELESLLRGSPELEKYRERGDALRAAHGALAASMRDIVPTDADGFVAWFGDNVEFFVENFAIVMRSCHLLEGAGCLALHPLVAVLRDSSGATGPSAQPAPTAQEHIFYCEDRDAAVVLASRAYEAGERVRILGDARYNDGISTSEMLWTFSEITGAGGGMADNSYSNGDDYILYEASLVETDGLYAAKQSILQGDDMMSQTLSEDGKTVRFPLLMDRMPEQLLSFLRLSRISDPAELALINFGSSTAETGIVSTSNEYEVLMLMMADCRERLSRYESSEADDEVRLINDLVSQDTTGASKRRLLASILRKQEKNILLSTMNACRQKLLPVRGLAMISWRFSRRSRTYRTCQKNSSSRSSGAGMRVKIDPERNG